MEETKQWEYYFATIATGSDGTAFNEVGKNGWELVAVSEHGGYVMCYFKRPKVANKEEI